MLALLVFVASVAAGETDPARLEEAKVLFRRGVALLSTGDTERALEAFLLSREIVPSGKNTANAAICLERLGRLDEALEMYEEVLARFSRDLDDDDRANLAPVMASLRQRIGYLELSANVDGLVVVDGRARGRLPLRTALRVMPGRRTVRIVKDGYRTFEYQLDIAAGRTVPLDAKLEPLAGTGAVRIEGPGNHVLEVFIDGRLVGKTPWEGALAGGRHVLRTAGAELGSRPEILEIIEGKTLLVRVNAGTLGASVRLSRAPETAELRLGDVPLGPGDWRGRLPVGRYEVVATDEGYFRGAKGFDVKPGSTPIDVRVELVRDPDHPRWPKPSRWTFEVGAELGPWLAPTLNADGEDACPSLCDGSRVAWGGVAAASLGAEHDSGFAGELVGGYLFFRQDFNRAVLQSYDEGTATYALQQTTFARGPILAARARARLPIGFGFDLVSAVGAGVFFGRYQTEFAGVVWTDASPVAANTTGPSIVSQGSPFGSATLGAGRAFGSLDLRAALGFWFFPTSGPSYGGPLIWPPLDCPGDAPTGFVGCVPESDALNGERAHRAFWAFVPQLGARYSF